MLGALGVLVVLGAAPLVHAEGRFGPHDIRTLFSIGKNTDKNQVQYGIRLDADCVPVGDSPIYPYWRVYEKNPELTEDLNFLDRTAYGVRNQTVEQRSPAGSKVVMRLRATSDRSIGIYVHKEGNTCKGEALTFISGVASRLKHIHVQLSGPLSVSYIDISGARVDDNQPITERAHP